MKTTVQVYTPFIRYRYVSISADGSSFYVTECLSSAAIQLGTDGTVIANGDLRKPGKVAVDSRADVLYLCSANNVHVLTPDCRKVKLILENREIRPLSVCYCRETDRLHVGMLDDDVIKVYQLK